MNDKGRGLANYAMKYVEIAASDWSLDGRKEASPFAWAMLGRAWGVYTVLRAFDETFGMTPEDKDNLFDRIAKQLSDAGWTRGLGEWQGNIRFMISAGR